MAAYLRLRRELCPRCGTAEADWIDPATYRYLDPPKWEATTMKCHGCAEMEATGDDVPKDARGVRVILLPAGEVDGDD